MNFAPEPGEFMAKLIDIGSPIGVSGFLTACLGLPLLTGTDGCTVDGKMNALNDANFSTLTDQVNEEFFGETKFGDRCNV